MKEGKKQILRTSLEKDDYDKFINDIKELEVTKENYEDLLSDINEIITDKMLNTDISNGGNSGERLLKTFSNDNEHNFLEYVADLRYKIARIFEEKLQKYIDADIKEKLDDFESTFML